MLAQISTAKGTMMFEMDVGFPYAERTFYEGMKEDKLAGLPGLVLNVNKGTKSLKAEAFPSVHPSFPKGIAISTGRGTGIRYL